MKLRATQFDRLVRQGLRMLPRLRQTVLVQHVIHQIDQWWCRHAFARVAQSRRSDGMPIRVVFLVRENQKWSSASVHEAMSRDARFDPFVAVSVPKAVHDGRALDSRVTLADNEAFFCRQNIRTQRVYEDGQFIPLELLKPDVIFYDQPYGLPRLHRPQRLRRSALICYSPYGFGFYLMSGSKQRVSNRLLSVSWKVFVGPEAIVRAIDDSTIGRRANISFAGDPKADGIIEQIQSLPACAPARSEHPVVIWAPHHSVAEWHHNQLATFAWSAESILQMATRSPEIQWVLKPHPMLWYSLVARGVKRAEELEAFLGQWNALPNTVVHESGGYARLFLDSDAMITDSGSFLLEYGLTGKPVIHLTDAPDGSQDERFSPIGRELIGSLYTARGAAELEQVFDGVVVDGNDPLWLKRTSTRVIAAFREASVAGTSIAEEIAAELLGLEEPRAQHSAR